MTSATVSVPEAATYLGIPLSTYYRLVQDGRLPGIKIGRRVVVRRDHLEQVLDGTWPVAS